MEVAKAGSEEASVGRAAEVEAKSVVVRGEAERRAVLRADRRRTADMVEVGVDDCCS